MVKNLPANAGDVGLIPGSESSPGGGNGNPLQYSCLENPMDRGAWWATVHGVAKRVRYDLGTKQLSIALEKELNILDYASVQFSRSVMSDSATP